jgi:hypothetical protein
VCIAHGVWSNVLSALSTTRILVLIFKLYGLPGEVENTPGQTFFFSVLFFAGRVNKGNQSFPSFAFF